MLGLLSGSPSCRGLSLSLAQTEVEEGNKKFLTHERRHGRTNTLLPFSWAHTLVHTWETTWRLPPDTTLTLGTYSGCPAVLHGDLPAWRVETTSSSPPSFLFHWTRT
jgi:hypothetical protein